MSEENKVEVKSATAKMVKNVEEIRPWARLFARMIDHLLYLLGPILILSFILNIDGLLMYVLVFGAIIITEGFLLSKWGYTPGKYLFAIQVRRSDSQKLSFAEATKRTWRVLLEGLWLMIPIFSIIGGINSWVYLDSNGKTSWDEKGGFIVRKTRD